MLHRELRFGVLRENRLFIFGGPKSCRKWWESSYTSLRKHIVRFFSVQKVASKLPFWHTTVCKSSLCGQVGFLAENMLLLVHIGIVGGGGTKGDFFWSKRVGFWYKKGDFGYSPPDFRWGVLAHVIRLISFQFVLAKAAGHSC